MVITKLQNTYTNQIVYCRNLNETVKQNDITFIRVYSDENPNREFLVNREAFIVV